MSRKKAGLPTVFELPLSWECGCGYITIRPVKEFKPPFFVCANCNRTIVFKAEDVTRRFSEQVKAVSEQHAALSKKLVQDGS